MSDQYAPEYDDNDYAEPAVERPGGSWEVEAEKPKPARRPNAPHIPENAPRPRDHMPKREGKAAPQREAEGDENVELNFRGTTFTVPADQEEWPILAVQAFANGRNIDAVQHLLGPRQWAVYVTKNGKKRDFDAFAELIADVFGFGAPGN